MTEIKNIAVYELNESIIASGLAMRLDSYDYNYEEKENMEQHIKRCCRLVQASKNTDVHCHDNFLTGIRVSFDIKYPQYLTPELQRYHWVDIVTSMSKMHRLTKMDIKKSCNKYVTDESINNLNKYIADYKKIVQFYKDEGLSDTQTAREDIYRAWMTVISNCPLGLELWMRISTNYKQLQTIYYQRRHHRLKEDWGAVIAMIERLPYFKEFILGENE